MELVKEVICHPDVYRHVADDFSPTPDDWAPIKDEQIHYLKATENDKLLGIFVFIPQNTICWEIHPCVLKCAWGDKAYEAVREAVKWIFKNTNCLKIVATIPCYASFPLRLAQKAGFIKYGVNADSHMRHGILHNQFLYGISRAEVKQWA